MHNILKNEMYTKLNTPTFKGVGYILFSILLFIATLTYDDMQINLLGTIGHYVGSCSLYAVGLGSYLVALYIFFSGYNLIQERPNVNKSAFCALIVSFCFLMTLVDQTFPAVSTFLANKVYTNNIVERGLPSILVTRHNLGGVMAYYLYSDSPLPINALLYAWKAWLFFGSSFVIALFFMQKNVFAKAESIKESRPKKVEKKVSKPIVKKTDVVKKKAVKERPIIAKKTFKSYKLPSPNLLASPKKIALWTLRQGLQEQAVVLEETLKNFNVDAKVVEFKCGPRITSFEIQPAVGVKVQKIKALSNDIALNMQAKSIRIVAPIPGRPVVGVEIPALHPQEVSFKEMLLEYQQGKPLNIPILLGKTVNGKSVITDMAKMPHALIAGATGSGKSVCINAIVMSILLTAPPDKVKLIMIDPKQVELTQYSKLPHMIAPVVSESAGAYAALKWLVAEMGRRYEVLKESSHRNIHSYNKTHEFMPYIVCIIDEFADLMMVSSTDIETPIARIAQMARAVGIHMILATQRPSREVITGIIKANFPTRITFKVSSRVNSQIIIDEVGAETLLGNGDLLFIPPGSSQPMRAQGAFVSDEEINHIISAITSQYMTEYVVPSFDKLAQKKVELEGKDELYDEALKVVMGTKHVSTTLIQRRLKIGYVKAANLMEQLEIQGVVGPADGAKPRKVLLQQTEL